MGVRFSILGPRHVLWRSRRIGRALLLLAGLLCAGSGIVFHPEGAPIGPLVAACVVGGLVVLGGLVAFSCHTAIELGERELRVQRRRLFSMSHWRVPRDRVAAVRVRAEVLSGDSESADRMVYVIALAVDGSTPWPLPNLRRCNTEVAARRLAANMARAAALPCEDAVGDEAVVRPLDGTRKAARSPMPDRRAPASITCDPGGLGAPPSCATRGWIVAHQRALATAVPWLSVPGVVIGVVLAQTLADGPIATLMIAGMLLAEVLLVGAVLVGLHVEERLCVVNGDFVVARRVFGLPLPGHRIPADAVEQVRVQSNVRSAPNLRTGIALLAEQRIVLCGAGLDADALVWLAAWIEAQLGMACAGRNGRPATS